MNSIAITVDCMQMISSWQRVIFKGGVTELDKSNPYPWVKSASLLPEWKNIIDAIIIPSPITAVCSRGGEITRGQSIRVMAKPRKPIANQLHPMGAKTGSIFRAFSHRK